MKRTVYLEMVGGLALDRKAILSTAGGSVSGNVMRRKRYKRSISMGLETVPYSSMLVLSYLLSPCWLSRHRFPNTARACGLPVVDQDGPFFLLFPPWPFYVL